MQLEATGKPLKYRLRTGEELLFQPGCPVDVPDESARELLKQAGDRVRVVSPAPVVIESAHQNARPVYWERANGRIYGPGTPEFLARVGDDFWIVATFAGHPYWIRSDRLRSRKAFEQQPEVREVKRIPGGLFRNRG